MWFIEQFNNCKNEKNMHWCLEFMYWLKIFFVRLTEFCFRYNDFFSSISFRSPKIWFWMEKFQKKKTKQHINTQNHT